MFATSGHRTAYACCENDAAVCTSKVLHSQQLADLRKVRCSQIDSGVWVCCLEDGKMVRQYRVGHQVLLDKTPYSRHRV